jgi:peptide/nickel transport system substrate-binding protein
MPVSSRRAARLIDSIESPDPYTAVMHWSSRYAFADQLHANDLTLLPSHLLEVSFDLRREQLVAHPYWRAQFVGLGPFKIEEWAGGTIRLAGVRDYFLGAPGLENMTVRFMADDNAAMAALLAGDVDFLLPRRAVPGVVQTIRQRWADGNDGTLSLLPGYSWCFLAPQFNGPQPDDLIDPRVRQALLCALDRGAIAEAVTGDRSLISNGWLPATDPRYALIAGDATRYPYDVARARELFRDAGWRRESADDVLVKLGRRFELEITTTQEWARAATVVAEYWRQVGVAVKETVLNRAASVDRQARAGYSGVELMAAAPSVAMLESRLSAANIPTAETQWLGGNRGHYVNPQFDALLERYWVTLDARDRETIEREITQRLAADLPLIGLYFYPAMAAMRRILQGVRLPTTVGPMGQPSATWNAHQWRTA